MPHSKCVACKTRLNSRAAPPDPVGNLCPECGALMEPVVDLAEVVGFRSIAPRDGAATGDTRERIADRLDDFLDRREAILARVKFDAGRWVDHEGSLRAEAVALPAPDTD